VFATASEVVLFTTADGTRVLFSATDAAAAAAALRERDTGSFALAPPTAAAPPLTLGLLSLLLLAVTALLVSIYRAMSRTTFVVSDAGLRIRGMFPGRPLAHRELRLDAARVVDLTEERGLRVSLRTWGAGMPGYVAGWCRLRDGQRALVQLTNRRRVLYLPTTLGYSLLLSSDDADVLLAALREHAASSSPA